jgi:DNA-binding LytR/AlgR family response regulator
MVKGDAMIKLIVCDDDQRTAQNIKNKVSEVSQNLKTKTEIYTYYKGKEILDLICNRKEQFDILLLDIDMPDISGLEVANAVRQSKSNIVLIFISSHDQYVFQSFEYRPFRYIRKNYIEEELPFAIRDAYKLIHSNKDKTIIVKVDDEEMRLRHSEIMYYAIENRKLCIHLFNQKVLFLRKTIKDFTNELCDNAFIQIHSGCVVNAKYIDKISNSDITFDNGESLIVSRTRIKDVKSQLLEYWGNQV